MRRFRRLRWTARLKCFLGTEMSTWLMWLAAGLPEVTGLPEVVELPEVVWLPVAAGLLATAWLLEVLPSVLP